MTNQLIALLNSQVVGTVAYQSGRLSFTYTEQWTEDPDAYPLSLSMPLSAARHGQSSIEPFLWGLLPDNDRVLQSWSTRYQVSAKNVFRLLTNVGEDCAGAIQFVAPERLKQVQEPSGKKDVEWLSEEDIALRLRALRGALLSGGRHRTRDNSRSPGHSRRPRCFLRGSAGAFLPAAPQPLIFLSRRPGPSLVMRKMSTTLWSWPGPSD